VPEFIVFTLFSIFFSWPLTYLFGTIGCLFRRDDVEDPEREENETK
jgi:hypothetical protein